MEKLDLKPDVAVLMYVSAPVDFEEDFVNSLERGGVSVWTQRIPSGPFAGIELYLPFAAMIYVAGKYFEGFLARAGERHFDLLSDAAKAFWLKAKHIRVTPIGSSGKVKSSQKYTMAYSVMGEIEAGLNFKLLMKIDVDQSESLESIDAFLRLIRDLHTGAMSQEDLAALLTYEPSGGVLLVTFDGKTQRIVPVNGFEIG